MVITREALRERSLERQLERDRAIHAAVSAGSYRRTVARQHGISATDVDEIVRRIDSSNRAILKACAPAPVRPPVMTGDVGWSARLRNCMVLDLGIPQDRLRDAAYLAEVLTRDEIMHTNRMNAGSVKRIEEFLAAHGFSLRAR